MSFGLKLVRKLLPAKWKYNNKIPALNDGKYHLGFMAQDLLEHFNIDEYAVVKKDDVGNYMVNYHELLAPMVKAIQELDNKVETLEIELKKYKTNN